MKIKTTTGQTLNTKDMNDLESDISMAINNLYELCSKYNLTCLTKVIVSNNKFIGAQNQASGPKGPESMEFLFNLINDFCINTTKGKIRLVKFDDDKMDEDNMYGAD